MLHAADIGLTTGSCSKIMHQLTTKENMECITVNVPGGHFLKWPSSSPDLSPIENLWAWMEQQLGPREGIKTTTDLAAMLGGIRDSITVPSQRHGGQNAALS